MTYLARVMAVFALAAGINTASVAVQQRYQLLTRLFGRGGWYAHLALIGPCWLWFLNLLPGLERHVRCPLPDALRPLGAVLYTVAGALWLQAFAQLGTARTLNGYVFGRGPGNTVRSGVFRWLRDPMYDSYALAFIAGALAHANCAYIALAAESYLLLNQFEARVENRPFLSSARTPR